MKMLLRFSKDERLKFISHLDMQRLFQRALRRAHLPLEYSNGFNPHIQMSIACALPVGVSSRGEYLEIRLTEALRAPEVQQRLNDALPPEVRILGAAEVPEGYPAVGSISSCSRYTFLYRGEDPSPALLLDKTEIPLEKKSKKGLITVNARPLILHLEFSGGVCSAVLRSSNTENLRADAFRRMLEETCGITVTQACREEILVEYEGKTECPLGV